MLSAVRNAVTAVIEAGPGCMKSCSWTQPSRRWSPRVRDVQALRRGALAQGMSSLRMAGIEKVKAGLTTMTEVLRVTPGDSETNPLFVGP